MNCKEIQFESNFRLRVFAKNPEWATNPRLVLGVEELDIGAKNAELQWMEDMGEAEWTEEGFVVAEVVVVTAEAEISGAAETAAGTITVELLTAEAQGEEAVIIMEVIVAIRTHPHPLLPTCATETTITTIMEIRDMEEVMIRAMVVAKGDMETKDMAEERLVDKTVMAVDMIKDHAVLVVVQ